MPEDLFEQIKDRHKAALKHQADWRKEAREGYDYKAGRQWTGEDLAIMGEQGRPPIVFDRTEVLLDAIIGTEINNRQEVRYIPRVAGTAGTNEILTGAAKWVRDECDAEDEESHAFEDACWVGMGWTETRLETDEDPAGKVVISRVDNQEMFWDPRARKRNISDAQWVMRVKDIDRPDAEEMFPDADEDDLHAQWATGIPDLEPHDATEAPYYKNDQKPDSLRDVRRKVRLVEYQWWEHETFYLALDPMTGEKKEFDKDDHKKLQARYKELGVEFESVKLKRKVFKRAFVGGKVLKEEENPCPHSFTYKCMTGKSDRNKGTFYGVFRKVKDPQQWANKWLSQTLHIINANAKGGVMAETDAVKNVRDFENDWAKPDSVTWVNSGGLQKIKEKAPLTFPAGMDRLLEFAVDSIHKASGIDPSYMATTAAGEPAQLDRQRKAQTLTILATLFANLRKYRKEQGRLLLYYITHYLADGRLVRITEQENQKYIPLLQQPGLEEFDTVVEDNPTAPSQKERTWAIVSQLLPILMKAPLPPTIWTEIIKQSPLPNSFLEKVQEIAKQPPQPNPIQQAQLAKLQGQAQKDMATAAKEQRQAQMPAWTDHVNISQLFPLLEEREQSQVLQLLGIKPTAGVSMLPKEGQDIQHTPPIKAVQ